MRLLVFTQALDRKDPVLSPYHRLVAEIARRFEKVTVICLKKGDYDLPAHVEVLSLGKESGPSRLKYVRNFYRFILSRRSYYDAVFVHMNQEYVLFGGAVWKLLGKPVYLWRNHHAGSVLTDVASLFCRKVFCTSKYSYTAKYRKTVLMPVGVDTTVFKPRDGANRTARTLLFLARMAPVKKPHVLIDALAILAGKGIDFSASLYGDPLPHDVQYYSDLKDAVAKKGLSSRVSFYPGITNEEAVRAYLSHEVFVNLSSSGMYDKTIFEAMACQSLVVATNRNLEGLIDPVFIAREDDAIDIAAHIEAALAIEDKRAKGEELRRVVEDHHSLQLLGQRLHEEIIS